MKSATVPDPTRRRSRAVAWVLGLAAAGTALAATTVRAAPAAPEAGATPSWPRGLPSDPAFFPIGVWLQSPSRAERYREAGINVYVGLWRGPTEAQMADLSRAGMRVICEQNAWALAHLDHPLIVGWMHGDEPDNAQALPDGKGYGPPILPSVVQRDYARMRAADPSRPVLLNLGQGVAWDAYIGRGVRRNHPEDYPGYLAGCDIASFDIYPAVHESPEVAGRLEFVARGVGRLVEWTGGRKPVWNCIECTRISNVKTKPTPAQVRSEVWMALIRGSRGLIYFVHQFRPEFREAALLDDPEMLEAVTAINREIRELAPVLNAPEIRDGVRVGSVPDGVPLAWSRKRWKGETYLFVSNLSDRDVRAEVRWEDPAALPVGAGAEAEVIGESRRVTLDGGRFSDAFGPYAVHRYRIR